MTDPRIVVIDELIRITAESLAALRNGGETIESFEAPRQEAFGRLLALDAELGPPASDLHVERLIRLQAYSDQLVAEVATRLEQTQAKLASVAVGRRGLSGYRTTAVGVPRAAKLGKG